MSSTAIKSKFGYDNRFFSKKKQKRIVTVPEIQKKIKLMCNHKIGKILRTRRWHVTISCQPDGRPPQPVRPWKSGHAHLAEGSNVVVLELPYSTEFGRGRAAI